MKRLGTAVRWLKTRWQLLRDPQLSPRDESILIDVPIEIAIERLRRVTRPRNWNEKLFSLDQRVLYGTVSADHVEIYFSSGAYDGEGQHVARFTGRFVWDGGCARLVGDYGPGPIWTGPKFLVGFLCVWTIGIWLMPGSDAERALFWGIGLAILVAELVGAPRKAEKLDGDMPLLRIRLRRELNRP